MGVRATESFVRANAFGSLHGTLELPRRCAPARVVLFVAGSGPTDRDGNQPGAIRPNSIALLAAGLAEHGIASLRFDKAGIAASRDACPKSERDLRFTTYSDDVAVLVRALRADTRFDRVLVAGHSEGSLLGLIAANELGVDGFVSLAGAGRPMAIVLREQLGKNLTDEALRADAERILSGLEAGRMTDDVPAALSALFRPSVQPYLLSWMKFSPEDEMRRLRGAALVVQGTTDIQVAVVDARRLHGAKSDSELVLLDDMNHVLKTARGGDGDSQTTAYTDPHLPLAAGLVPRIVAFVEGVR